MGRVLRAHDPTLGRDVALKLVETGAVSADSLAEVRYLFHREARATAALHHPGIIEIYDYSGADAELPYLACELCDGPRLRDVLEARGALPAAGVAAIGHELASALAHAHGNGIVHRDLKPENVIVRDDGTPVLVDFGIAHLEVAGAAPPPAAGTLEYMAPEQASGEVVDGRADLYALGVICFEWLVGFRPLALAGRDVAEWRRILETATAPRVGEFRPDVGPEVDALVAALLAARPHERPPDARAVVRLCRRIP
jgi:serine/threonine-protein kinase